MTDHQDVIAAFVDNEPVGAEDLAAALKADEGRAYLIDLLVLRGLVGDARPSVAPGLQPRGVGVHGATGLQSRGLWLTAAALLVAAMTGGFFAGRQTLVGGDVFPSPAPIVTPAGSAASPAPAPTHVIRMEKGANWNERSGGN